MRNLLKKSLFHFFILAAFIVGNFSIAESQNLIIEQTGSEKHNNFLIDWSAQTFVPADYQGKPLPTFQSTVVVSATALPDTDSIINEMNYTFNWTLDNVESLSLTGNTASFEVTNGSSGKHTIYLRIFTKDRDLVDTYFFEIPVSRHDVVVYKESSDGLLDDINGIIYVEAGSEAKFIAKPFFFNNISKESDLTYTWKLDGKGIQKSSINPDILSLSFPDGLVGGSSYSLTITAENPFDAYQIISKDYKIVVK